MTGALLRDAAKYLLAFLLTALIELARLPVLTHALSPEHYGDYALIISAASLLSLLSVTWISGGILRFSPRLSRIYPAGSLTPIFLLVGVASTTVVAFLAVAVFAATPFLKPLISTQILVLALLLLFSFSLDRVFVATLRSRRDLWRNAAFVAIQGPLGLLVGYWLASALGLGVSGFVLGAFAASCLAIGVLGAGSHRPGVARGLLADRSVAAEFVRYGLPVVGINLLTWATSSSDRFLIALFRGADEVGLYASGYTLAEKSIFLFTYVVSLATHPLATLAWDGKGREASRQLLRQAARLYLLTAMPATLGLALLAETICRVVLPAEYLATHAIVAPIAAGAFLLGLGNLFTEPFALRQRTDLLLACYAAAALVNVTLNIILIPRGGYAMAALSTFVAYATFLLITVPVSRKMVAWSFPWPTLVRAAIASAALGLAVLIISRGLTWSPAALLVAGVGGGGLAYGAGLLLLGEVRGADLARARATLARIVGPGASAPTG